MSDTVGRIDLILDVDGKNVVGKIRKHGEKAGREAGEGFNDKFGDEITKGAAERNKEIGKEGRKAGESYSDARDNILRDRNKKFSRNLVKAFETPKGLSDYVNQFDDARDAYKQLRFELDELHKANLISDEDWKRNRATLAATSKTVYRHKDAANKAAAAQERLNRDWDEAIKHNKDYDKALVTNQRNLVKWRKQIEGDLNRKLAQVAREQREAAKASADWAKSLEKSRREAERLDKELGRLRISTLNVFKGGEKTIGRYADKFPEASEGTNDLRRNLDRLRRANRISAGEFTKHIKALDLFDRKSGTTNGVIGKLTGKFSRLFGVVGLVTSKIRGLTSSFGQMPYIFKQIAGYTALFTALAPAIAVLGSATGSGALALATNVGALGLAVVTLIPAFKGMLDDIDKLPEAARPAAQALQDMATPLSELQDTIQTHVWKGLGDDIQNLTSKVFPVLTKGFAQTGDTINGIFADMIKRITSKDNLALLSDIFTGLQPILADLGGTLSNLTGAIGTLFKAALPSGQNLAGWLEQITGSFNDWLKSTDGQQHLQNFFDHLNEIMPSIGKLIGAAGKAVSSLVTDKAVDNLTSFFDVMSDAIPNIVGPLGTLIDHLDPLGGAAKVLQGIGNFFSDHTEDFAKFGTAIQDLFSAGFDYFAPILSEIGDAILKIAPDILKQFTDALTALNTPENQKAWSETIPKVGDALLGLAEAISGLIQFESKTHIVSTIIETIGNVAQVAAAPLKLLGGVFKVATGDFKGFFDAMAGIDFEGFLSGLQGIANLTGVSKIADITRWLLGLFGIKIPDPGEKLAEWGRNLNDFFDGLAKIGPFAVDALVQGAKTAVSSIGSIVGDILGALFGFGGKGGKGKNSDKPKKAGEQAVDDAKTAAGAKVLGITSILGDFIARLFGFGGGGGKDKGDGKKAGEKAVTDAEKAAKDKASNVGSIVETLFGALFKGIGSFDIGSFITKPFQGIGDKIGGFFKDMPDKVGGFFDQLLPKAQKGADNTKQPFSGVTGAIGTFLNPLGSVVDGIMGKVDGKKGADNTKNPFSSVLNGIMGWINPVPGKVTGKVGEASGQKGADNTKNPFAPLLGAIQKMINAIPSKVTAKIAEASGQRGADNTANPFQKVPGRVQGHVGGIPGIISRALSGVTGTPAADRIVSAFTNIRSRISSAVGNLGGFINGLLSGARTAVSAGIGAIRNLVPKTAVGGTFSGEQLRIIGEAGPEAVVPLARPLSQVDPSVRRLSAIAQGKFPATDASGGPSKQITVAEGAIQLLAPNSDADQVASAVLDRLVSRLP